MLTPCADFFAARRKRLLTRLHDACTPCYGGPLDYAAMMKFRKACDAVKRQKIGPVTLCSLYLSPDEWDLWIE